MKVSVKEIKSCMRKALAKRGYLENDIDFIIKMYLGGELRGHSSHGLGNFASFALKDFSKLPKPEVMQDTESLYMVDAKSNSGNLVGRAAAEQAIEKSTHGIVGVAMIKNMRTWEHPGAIAQHIAERGYVGIVINNGGVANMAPPGGFDRTLGTNPIAYGIPTSGSPLVVDMATSKVAWGQVRLANRNGADLPADCFYNNEGDITLDPAQAHSVLPFGDYKGYALALLIEILCGSLIGRSMMIVGEANNKFGGKTPDRGAVIIVINPSKTVGLEAFKSENTDLLDRIKSTRSLNNQEIRIPGERAGKLEQDAIENDVIDIPKKLWEEIKSLE